MAREVREQDVREQKRVFRFPDNNSSAASFVYYVAAHTASIDACIKRVRMRM